jgi:hypothetical protein
MKRWILAVVALLAVGAAVLFEPWTAFQNSTVNEAAPSASAPAPDATDTKPVELARGTFVSQEHDTSGAAQVLRLADGSLTLRLEGFETTNGPDLHVWLSDRAAGGSWFKYDEGNRVELGELKANKGDHNYAIPADADLGDVNSVVIWCKRFRVAFGSAKLRL